MRAPRAFHRFVVHRSWPGPAFWCAKNDHRPHWNASRSPGACVVLNRANFRDDHVQRLRHLLMHDLRIMTLYEVRLLPVARKKLRQFRIRHSAKHGRVGDFVSIQMQNGQNRSIPRRIEKLIGMPTRRQRTRFGFTVANYAANQQRWITKSRAICVRDRVAQFPSLMDRAGSFGSRVAGNAAGERKLLEEFSQSVLGFRNIWIKLAVSAFQIRVCNHSRPSVPGTSHIDNVQIVLFDQPVEMYVNEIQSWRRSPMAKQARLNVLNFQWLR